jgi:outer membrane protein
MRKILGALVISVVGSITPAWAALEEITAEGDGGGKDEATRPTWRGSLGGGLVAANQTTGDNTLRPFPVVAVTYRDTAYWRLGQAGLWFYKTDNRLLRLGLALKTRRGFASGTSVVVTDLEERDLSIEGGVTLGWINRWLIVNAGYFTDVSNTTDGNTATLGLSHPFRLSARWNLTPSIGAEWQSAEVVDYYYGVRASEATATRPAYTGRDTVNLRLGLVARYRFADPWSLFVGASRVRLGSGIADSPWVVRDRLNALYGGVVWRF